MNKIDQIYDQFEKISRGTIFRVWSTESHKDPLKGAQERKYGTGIERCLMTADGDYIGIESGKLYSKRCHYHSDNIIAQIVSIDDVNKTGMLHLYGDNDLFPDAEENEATKKRKYLGAIITVQEVHNAGEHTIYRCQELDEFFSDDELKIL